MKQTLRCFQTMDLDRFRMELENCLSHFTSDTDKFRATYLREEIFSKYFDPATASVDLVQPAIDKMLVCESRCREINLHGHAVPHDIMFYACRVVGQILGAYVPFNTLSHCDLSGGATLSHKRRFGHPIHKLDIETKGIDVTEKAKPFLDVALKLRLGEVDPIYNIVSNGRFATVPKNNVTDRPIDIQPTGNIFLQKGVGATFRRALRKVGINLNDQSHNRDMARKGSLDGSLATIDLSSASDMISSYIVLQLLPTAWYKYLSAIRTEALNMPDGSVLRLERFSSMGNGFTFELESLIFYALGKACLIKLGLPSDPSHFSVYGDDIVIDSRAASLLIEILEQAGFKPNVKKTFTEGPFRESCGGHYFNGAEVTPFYIRGPVDTVDKGIVLLNNIRRVFSTDGIVDPRMYLLWKYVYSLNKQHYRLFLNDVPPEGDSVVSIPRVNTGYQLGFIKLRKSLKFREPARLNYYHLKKDLELLDPPSYGHRTPMTREIARLFLGSLDIVEPIPTKLRQFGGRCKRPFKKSVHTAGAPAFPQELGVK